jgi:DNA-binding response OmpR family regulator
MRILLDEDEEKLATVLVHGLSKKGYAVDYIMDGEKAMKRISLNHIDYDLVILDLMLPSLDGLSICRGMRDAGITTPVLILTARDEIEMKVKLLLTGADDYLVKPFAFEELCARIAALSRRPGEVVPSIISAGDITLKSAEHVVMKRNKPVPLTLKEFVLLEYFMRHPNIVINREELLTHLWDFNYSSFSNVVDVHVKNLRKKLDLENSEVLLETIRGVGYRFAQQVS